MMSSTTQKRRAYASRAHQETVNSISQPETVGATSQPKQSLRTETAFPAASSQAGGGDFSSYQQLPLIISVTGHRDPHPLALEELETTLRAVFRNLQSAYPHTPLVLLSMLAEGADMLTARIGLEMGARLIVPLPLPLDLYRRDFDSPQATAAFDALLKQAEAAFILPLVEGSTRESVAVQGASRDKQYALGGAFLARYCQILIAFWDGTDNGKTGGTAQVVRFKMRDITEPYAQTLAMMAGVKRSHLDTIETGPVYQIVTPRASQNSARQQVSLIKHFRHENVESAELAFNSICRNVDNFNADTLNIYRHTHLQTHVSVNASYLIAPETLAILPLDAQYLCHDFAIADTLAQIYQKHVLKMLHILFAFVFTAAVLLEIYSDILMNLHILLLSYSLLLIIAFAFWFFGLKKSKAQDRYQDYRALAEGLRVAFFWRVARLPISVADHYLRKQKSELDWIRIALRNASSQWRVPAARSSATRTIVDVNEGAGNIPVTLTEEETSLRLEIVAHHWVEDQQKYFAKSAARSEKKSEHFERWVKRLFSLSFVIATLDAILLLTPPVAHFIHHFDLEHIPHLHSLMIVSIVLPAVAGASLHTYSDKLALLQHAKQYKRMENLFTTASERLKEHLRQNAHGQAHDLIRELGMEALAENGDWVMIHRERPVEVPQG